MTHTEAIQTLRELDAQIISPREPKSTFLQIAEAFEEATNHCLCAYCGAKLPKDSAAVMAHIEGCEKHPTQKFLAELDKAKSLAEEAMKQAKETGEAWEQLAACWPAIQVDCDDQVAAAQLIVADHESLRARNRLLRNEIALLSAEAFARLFPAAEIPKAGLCEQDAEGKPCGNPARVAWTMCGETKLLCTAHAALICRSVGSFVELQIPDTASNREGGGGGGSETSHRHGLLVCLAEECAEIGQSACKALRFGLRDEYRGEGLWPERDIAAELDDLRAVVELLEAEGLGLASDPARIAAKKAKLAKMNAYTDSKREVAQNDELKGGTQ